MPRRIRSVVDERYSFSRYFPFNAYNTPTTLEETEAVVRLVRDQTLAEDLISDVFLDVWRHAGRFEARSAASTWLLAIARYKAPASRTRSATRAFTAPGTLRPFPRRCRSRQDTGGWETPYAVPSGRAIR